MSRPLRLAILTSGRFHVCDLARELDALGHDVAFYSCLPAGRTREFGLPDRCNRSLFWLLAPLFFFARRAQPGCWRHLADRLLIEALDGIGAKVVKPCDVLVGMSGMSARTALAARNKHGAKIWIERGSRHILSQKEILERMPGAALRPKPVTDYAVRRELADYALADKIVVPSRHAERSFLERGEKPARLFRNPYGVDLRMFPPTPAPEGLPPTVISAGAWSLQKGSDILAQAWSRLPDVRLVHVGPVHDAALPQSPRFTHHDPVDQVGLREFYAQAHVFALASRQDGLAMVLPQALSSGLPVVCTDRTGGEDLREFMADPSQVSVVPADDAQALAEALSRTLTAALRQQGPRDPLGPARNQLSWRRYGQRYSEALCAARS